MNTCLAHHVELGDDVAEGFEFVRAGGDHEAVGGLVGHHLDVLGEHGIRLLIFRSGGALALHERVDDLRQILGLGVGQRNEVYVAFALGSGDIQRADRVTRHADGFGIAVDEQAVGAFVGQHEADGGAALFGVLLIPAFEDFGERGGQRLGIAVLQA